MAASLKSVFFACQAAARVMIPQGGGKIVNIGSNFGVVAFKGRSVYAAAKAGVHHLSRALSLEWAKHGVSVNVVAPCITETESRKVILERPGYKEWATDADAARRALESAGGSGRRRAVSLQPSVRHGRRPRADGRRRLDDSLTTHAERRASEGDLTRALQRQDGARAGRSGDRESKALDNLSGHSHLLGAGRGESAFAAQIESSRPTRI